MPQGKHNTVKYGGQKRKRSIIVYIYNVCLTFRCAYLVKNTCLIFRRVFFKTNILYLSNEILEDWLVLGT